MAADFLIGIDLGTSAIKGILVSASGEVVAQTKEETELLKPEPGRVEFSADKCYRKLCRLIRKLSKNLPAGGKIQALSISAASGNTLLLDKDKKPNGNAISWLDQRAGSDYQKLLPNFTAKEVHEITGWPSINCFPLTILAWLKQNCPECYYRSPYKIMNITYIFLRLTGKLAIDYSTATTSYLYDQVRRSWYQPFLDALEIDKKKLPQLLASGTNLGCLLKEAAITTDLGRNTKVVLGAFDHHSTALGCGVSKEGQLSLSCGTSWVGFYPLNSRETALEQGLLIDPFLFLQDHWGGIFSLSAIGLAIDAEITRLLAPKISEADKFVFFTKQAASSRPEENNIFWNPLQPCPLDRQDAAASCRAIMEGCAFGIRRKVEELSHAGIGADEVTLAGGPAENPIWPQIIADITGLKLRQSGIRQYAGALGAAILAGKGADIFRSYEAGFAKLQCGVKHLLPDPKLHKLYTKKYVKYLSLFNCK